MDSLRSNLLTSLLILPFTAGNYRRRQNGSWYYDCIISSRVLFLILLAIVIVFTASKRIPTHTEIRIGFVLILLSLLMILAIIGFSVLGCLIHKHGHQYIVAARRNASTLKLQVLFLWLFGLGSVFYCAFVVGKQIECSENTTGGYLWYILLYFNFIVILSLFSQMVAITYFSPYELKHTPSVNFAMSMMLVANVCVFVYGTLMDNTFLYITNIYPDSNLAHCLENKSTISLLLEKSKPILRPHFTEFCLISCMILLEIWSPTEMQVTNGETRYATGSDIRDYERSPLLPNLTETDHRPLRNRGRRTACQMITMLFCIPAGLGFVVCYIVMAMDIGNIENMRHVAEIYEQAIKVITVLAIFVGFFCLVRYCTSDSSSKGLKSREYLYLLSAFGLFMSHICKAIGGDISSDKYAYLFLITSVIGIFEDYLQVVFLLYANRCKKSYPRSNIHLLDASLIILITSNFTFWLNNTFILSEFPITRMLEHDGVPVQNLSIVYNVLLPMSVFFRFFSFLEYYATFGKLNA